MSNAQEDYSYKESIVMEMLSYYKPTPAGETADEELTSVELADRFSDTVDITPSSMSIFLAKAGFHVVLRGSKYYWKLTRL